MPDFFMIIITGMVDCCIRAKRWRISWCIIFIQMNRYDFNRYFIEWNGFQNLCEKLKIEIRSSQLTDIVQLCRRIVFLPLTLDLGNRDSVDRRVFHWPPTSMCTVENILHANWTKVFRHQLNYWCGLRYRRHHCGEWSTGKIILFCNS